MITWCETCGATSGLTRSHFVKNNSVHKNKATHYDYENPENWFIQCLTCHMEYEKLSKISRYKYMLDRRLVKYANRISWLINGEI